MLILRVVLINSILPYYLPRPTSSLHIQARYLRSDRRLSQNRRRTRTQLSHPIPLSLEALRLTARRLQIPQPSHIIPLHRIRDQILRDIQVPRRQNHPRRRQRQRQRQNRPTRIYFSLELSEHPSSAASPKSSIIFTLINRLQGSPPGISWRRCYWMHRHDLYPDHDCHICFAATKIPAGEGSLDSF